MGSRHARSSFHFLVRTLCPSSPSFHIPVNVIQRRSPVEEFALSGEEITSDCGGHVLTFKFVHVDGVWKHLDCVCNIKYTVGVLCVHFSYKGSAYPFFGHFVTL